MLNGSGIVILHQSLGSDGDIVNGPVVEVDDGRFVRLTGCEQNPGGIRRGGILLVAGVGIDDGVAQRKGRRDIIWIRRYVIEGPAVAATSEEYQPIIPSRGQLEREPG